MAITFIGSGTLGDGNNVDVTPTLHASTAQNDFIVVTALLRGENVTDGAMALVAVGSGYTSVFNFTHSAGSSRPRLLVYWKIAGAGEGNPLVDITPLIAGASVIAQCHTFRGTHLTAPIDVTGATSENASAQDIGAISGITATANDGAVIVVGGKCDDWTSVATLSGDGLTWNEASEAITILGQDAGVVCDYAIWVGAPPTVAAKTFVVTGGISQKGLGGMFSIKPPTPPPAEVGLPQLGNIIYVMP